jgi:3',5'-cyclic AMP phosphodiesterase CpdA
MLRFSVTAVAMRRSLSFAFFILLALAGRLRAESPATQPKAKILARIALLGDPHVNLDPKLSQYLTNFQHVIDDVNASNVDFVLIAGDLTQSGDAPSLRRFKEMITGFHTKVFCVAGNHDVGQKPLGDQPATVTSKRVEQFESIVGPEYFTADLLPTLHLIGITSSLFSSGIEREEPQWEFLQSELARNRPGLTLLLTHYPPYAVKPDEPRGYFNMELPSRSRLLALLQLHPNTMIVSAHLHRPIFHNWQNILDVGAPAISFGIPAGSQAVGWTEITLHDGAPPEVVLHYPPIPKEPPGPRSERMPLPSAGAPENP